MTRGRRRHRNKTKPVDSKPYHEQLETTLKSTESTLSEKTKGAQKPGASKIQLADPSNKSADACLSDLHDADYDGEKEIEKQLKHFRANDQFSVKQYLIKKTVEDDVPGDKWNGTNAWDAENRRSQSKSGGPLIFRGRGRGRFVSSNGSDRVRGGRGQGIVGARNDRFGYRGNIPTEVTVFGSTMETQCGTLQEKSDEEVKVEDELQLRPTISSFDWEKASREVSLFEDALKNHFFVKKYPTIKGMNKNIFFLSHDVFEKEDEEQKSMFNQHEAEIALNLAKYLTKQDYSQQQITILATCSGQLFYLQKLQKKSFENLSQIRISVVANYLGEKDDIIILSLVRSNKDSNIGFLLSLNRVCAVLSRAKHGLYIIGNMECLKSQSELWNRIYTTLNNMNEIGNQLDLVCQVHDTVTQVTNACDFAAVTNGGCMQKCYAILNCGHLCQRICHFDDRDHLQYQCNKTCDRYICSEKHRCPRKCFEECEKCIIKVEKNLPCGHTATLPCFVDSLDYKCIRLQVYTLDCGHFIKLQCQNRQLLAHFSTFCSIPCNIPCNIPLPCGHQCTRQCHLNDDPEHKKYVCKKKCEKKNKGCKEDHQCRRLCSEDCMKCEVTIKATLPCGHEARIECGADIQKHICTVEVKQVFPKCLHSITKPCYKVQEYVDLSESFEDSKNQVHDTVTQVTNASDFAAVTNRGCMQKCYAILNCGHLCQRICHFDDRDHLQYQCNETCDRYICSEKHRCPRKCFEECEKCIIKVEKTLPCGHTATLPCFVDSLDYKCIRLQVYTLDCGHFIKLQCQNRQLLAHFSTFCSIPCNIPCNIPLPCGHQCTRQCHLNDDPEHKKYVCKKKCEKKNKGCKEDHQCRRLCSEDCMKCEVTIKATLPCGHEARIECGADIQKHICTVEVKQVFPKCLHSITKPCYKVQEYVDLSESFEDSKNQVHDTVTQVTNASDFAAVTNRGCMQKCYAILNCGHLCQRICHFDDRDHLQYQCNETCDRYICSEKHRCPRKCFEECEKCIIKVEKTLPCGHTATLPCFVDSLDYKCIRLQVYTLDCGHFIKLQCQNRQLLAHFSTFCSIPCNIPCNIPLPCGHQCTRQCHLNDDPEHKKYVCKKKCEKKNKGCKGDHQCRRLCSEDCMKCEVTIKATLPCGHEARIECGADIQKHICTVEVKQVFPKCLHSITKPCYKVQEYVDLSESFEDSKNQVHDTVTQVTNASDFAAVTNRGCMQKCYAILNCGHLCQRICHFDDRDHLQYQCNETCDRYICSEKHRCPRKCFEECEKCIIEVETFLPCGHTVTESWCKCDNSQTNTFDSGQTIPESSWLSWLWPRSSAKQTEDTSSVSAKLICVEPCRKKVKCGHCCPNLCGDPCIMPSDCLICNKIKEEKDKSEKEARKRQLETYQEIAQQKALEYRNETTRFKVSGLDPSSSVFVDVRDKVLKYIQPAHSWHPEVTSVQEVFNANLLEAFYLCQTNLFEPSTSREKFHGTNTEACENIITNGFRLPRNDGQQRMFGFGIYFATDSSKSAQQIYTKGSNILILCDVLLGKEMKVSTPQYIMNYNTIKSLGYDSLFAPRDTKSAGGVLFDKFVIYDPRQAYPRYIINFKATQMGVPLGSILSAKFQKHEIYPSRYFNPSNELDYHFRVAEAQFRRLCQNRDVIKVTYVRNPALESQFLETSKQFAAKYGAGAEEANPILAFHGTPIEKNIESILKNNFQRSYIKRTAYGHGHYFSEFPETALGYAGSVKALILCKILAGRSLDVTGTTLLTNGYDSLRVKKDAFGRGTMIIIDNEKQILPQYVVHIN
ncbi:uncharacterized protein LOC136031433 isoform X4 [Artemia franciscana]|uniref:uncharacterized protein LOC136031433 isoform X4 n=1 Tax=Artemia franciscana TaxID=6661 RepID=UPI0032D9BB83